VTSVASDGSVNCSHVDDDDAEQGRDCSSPEVGCKCYGWTNQSKPVLPLINGPKLITGLTAIIHMDQGVVSHIMWDSQCNLCQGRNDGTMTCLPDWSRAVCQDQNGWSGGGQQACVDCYLDLDPTKCRDEACAPTVFVAWEGTDSNGMPLLSSGGILSRFQQYSLNGVYDELRDEILEVPDTRRRLADAWQSASGQ